MPKLLVCHPIPTPSIATAAAKGATLEILDGWSPRSAAELCEAVNGCDGLVTMLIDDVDASVVNAAVSSAACRVIANVAVGADNIDLAAARARGLAICTTPGVLNGATAEIAMFLLIAAARRTREAESALRAGADTSWRIDRFVGMGLENMTLGLVGFGGIARAVAKRAQGFDMDVIHHTRHPTGTAGWVRSLEELCERADAVSVHVPLTNATEGLLGRRHFELIGAHGILVNTSRGAVVAQDDLLDALEEGSLGAAGLDVFVGEPNLVDRLARAPRVVVLPHIGSATAQARSAMVDLAIDGALSVLGGKRPVNQLTL